MTDEQEVEQGRYMVAAQLLRTIIWAGTTLILGLTFMLT